MRLSGFISAAYFDYVTNDQREGPVLAASVNVERALSSSQILGARVTVTREFAAAASFRSTDNAIRFSYVHELGEGVTIEISPTAAYRPFDEQDPLFAKRRRDYRYGADLSVLKRDWTFKGWAPVVGYAYTRNISTINLYDFSRHRGELRFTRLF